MTQRRKRMRIELILTPEDVLIIKRIVESAKHDSECLMSSNRLLQYDKEKYQKINTCCDKFGKMLGLALDNETYTFETANGNGHSSCFRCGLRTWDSFMYKVKELDDARVCSDCKKILEKKE